MLLDMILEILNDYGMLFYCVGIPLTISSLFVVLPSKSHWEKPSWAERNIGRIQLVGWIVSLSPWWLGAVL